LVRRAEELNESGEFAAALELLEQAVELDSGISDAYVARGWALENHGPDRYSEAQAAYERALELEPSNPWGRQGLAHLLEVNGEVEEARTLYRAVVSDHAEDLSTDADLLEIVGWCRHRLGDHQGAERTFRRAVEVDPSRAPVRFDLGLALFSMARDAEGLEEVESGLRVLESKDQGYRRAVLKVALEDFDEAAVTNEHLRSTEAGRARASLEGAIAALPKR
jgi:tetratricopeptide (TPR) repeat protein